MLACRFHPGATREFREAARWYEEQREGLGVEFSVEVRRAVGVIRERPEMWAFVTPRSRRCLLRRFPYAIVYQIRPDGVYVVSVSNLHRDQSFWRQRE
jgi:hypothetical protein